MLKIKLEIDKKVYELDSLSYSSYSPSAEYPNSSVSFSVGIKSNRMDQAFLDWCLGQPAVTPKDGKITIFNQDDDVLLKTILFKKGTCNTFSESYYGHDSYNSYPINLNIAAESLTVQLGKQKQTPSNDERFA